MDKVTFINKIKEIGSCEDSTNRIELLTQLQEEVSKDYDDFSSIRETNNQLSSDNEALRSANMKLFLRIGDKEESKKEPFDDGKEKRKFENLFNEKGELK